MTRFTRVELLKDMIDLFGGLRFRHMNLCKVDGMRLLPGTCEKRWKHCGCTQPILVVRNSLWKACKFQLTRLQLGPPFKTLTYPGTNRFGLSRSRYPLLTFGEQFFWL